MWKKASYASMNIHQHLGYDFGNNFGEISFKANQIIYNTKTKFLVEEWIPNPITLQTALRTAFRTVEPVSFDRKIYTPSEFQDMH